MNDPLHAMRDQKGLDRELMKKMQHVHDIRINYEVKYIRFVLFYSFGRDVTSYLPYFLHPPIINACIPFSQTQFWYYWENFSYIV